MSGAGGPRWAEWLMRACAGAAEAEWVLAELETEHAQRAERDGVGAARRWYARQAVRSALPLAARRWELRRRNRTRTGRSDIMVELWRDVRLAARGWLRTPLFTLLSVLMLALGMGGTLAVFSVVNGVLLTPLEYPGWQRLVHIEGGESSRHGVSYPVVEDLRASSQMLEEVVAWQGWSLELPDMEGVPVRRSAASVSANFFRVLGARPVLGRLFEAEDEPLGHAPVVVLSYALWQNVYGGDPAVVGQPLRTEAVYPGLTERGEPGPVYTIVGVAPEDFRDPVAAAIPTAQPLLWRARPAAFDATVSDRGWIGFWAFGRLRAGATPEAAGAEARRIVRAALFEAERDPELAVATFRDRQVRAIRPTLILLFGAVLGVLLIACANLANLLLSRATGRAREVAVRASLGAHRGRLVRQLLTETVVLCLAGGVLGLTIAWAGGTIIVGMAGGGVPEGAHASPDARVIIFALMLSLGSALAAGLAPALRLTDTGLGTVLRDGGRGGLASRRGQRFRHGLVVAETALALVLLAGAGLLLRTAWNLLRTDPGFEAANVLTLRAAMLSSVFPTPEAQDNGLAHVLSRVQGLPGVATAAAISDLPMSGAVNSTPVRAAERLDEPGVQTLVRAITPAYFEAMGIGIEHGRAFGGADGRGAPPVAVVNRTLAERLLGGANPVGRRVVTRGVTQEIVGVVEDVKEFSLAGGPDPVLYTSFPQEAQPWMRTQMSLVVRTRDDPGATALAVREAIREAQPMMGVDAIRPMTALIERDTQAPRFRALLIGIFAALALALAAAGTGGLAAYTVSRRLPEMGLRMALGATRAEIARLVLGQAARLTLAGIGLGLLAALAAARLVARFLVGVPATDAAVLGVAAFILAVVGIASTWPPAARAARADPASTLRAD